jgi:hypothetical protein
LRIDKAQNAVVAAAFGRPDETASVPDIKTKSRCNSHDDRQRLSNANYRHIATTLICIIGERRLS